MTEALRVLIAEDDPIMAETLRELVALEGHEVCGIVRHGGDVLDAVLSLRPGVVLMDVHLAEGSSGVEATRQLLERVTVPVLIISGTDSPGELAAVAQSGALGFLRKPVSADSLQINLELAARQNAVLTRLRDSEYLHRSIFDNAAVGIYVCHPEGRYMACNQAFARILGYNGSGEMLHCISSIDEQVYVEPGRRQELLELLRQGRSVKDFESQVYGRDGDYVWIAEHIAPGLDENGALQYYEGIVLNITERVRAREAEALALALARTAMEAMAEFVAVTDLDRNIITSNKAFEDAIGVHLGDMCRIGTEAETPELFSSFLRESALHGQSAFRAEGILELPEVPFALKASITPYRTAEGKMVGAVFVMRPKNPVPAPDGSC